MKNHVFHAEERIYNLHISFSELVLLSGRPLLALSMTFCAQLNSFWVGICAELRPA